MYVGSPNELIAPKSQPLPVRRVRQSSRRGRKVAKRQRNQRVLRYGLNHTRHQGYFRPTRPIIIAPVSSVYGSACSTRNYDGVGWINKPDSMHPLNGPDLNPGNPFPQPLNCHALVPGHVSIPEFGGSVPVEGFPGQFIYFPNNPAPSGRYGQYGEVQLQCQLEQNQLWRPTQETYQPFSSNDLNWDPRFAQWNTGSHANGQICAQRIIEDEKHPPVNESVPEQPTVMTPVDDEASSEPKTGSNGSGERDWVESETGLKKQEPDLDTPESSDGDEGMAEAISRALITTVLGPGAFYNGQNDITNTKLELHHLVASTVEDIKALKESQFNRVKEEEEKFEKLSAMTWTPNTYPSYPQSRLPPLTRFSQEVIVAPVSSYQQRADVNLAESKDNLDESSESENEAEDSRVPRPGVASKPVIWVKVQPWGEAAGHASMSQWIHSPQLMKSFPWSPLE